MFASKKIVAGVVAALTLTACEERAHQVPQANVPVRIPHLERPPVSVATLVPVAMDASVAAPFVDALALPDDAPKLDHLALARVLKRDGAFDDALVEARKSLVKFPNDEQALTFIARLSTQLGQHALAQGAQERIAEIKTDDAVPLVRAARSAMAGADFDAAVTRAGQAILRDPFNADAHHVSGRAHLARGELKAAIDALEIAASLDPQNGYVLNTLGLAYLRANENEKAREVLEVAVDQVPNVAYVHNNLGVALERLALKDDAAKEDMAASTLSPKYVKALINSQRVAKVMLGTTDAPQDESSTEAVTPE